MLRLPESLIGAVFSAGGLAIAISASRMEGMGGLAVGPGTLPLVIGIGFMVFGSALVVQGLPELRSYYEGRTALVERRVNPYFPLIVVASLAAYIPLLPLIGFIPLTAVFVTAIVVASGGAWTSAIVFAALATAVIQFVFSQLLRVPLPLGLLG